MASTEGLLSKGGNSDAHLHLACVSCARWRTLEHRKVPENGWRAEVGNRHYSAGGWRAPRTLMAPPPPTAETWVRMGFIALFVLRKQGLPCRGPHGLQRTLHINGKVQAELQVASDSKGRKVQGLPLHWDPWAEWAGSGSITGWAGRQDCQLADAWEGCAPRTAGHAFQQRNFLAHKQTPERLESSLQRPCA